MSTVIAFFISIIVGIIIEHIINTKFTTDEHVGNFIGIAIALILIAFFFSDNGQIFLRRLIEVFPIKLK